MTAGTRQPTVSAPLATGGTESPVHATCVARDGRGVLLRGPSGSGKSDLALRLLEAGFELVADDQVLLAREGGRVTARAPAALAGLIELRGIGILRLGHLARSPVDLVVDLGGTPERLPEDRPCRLLGTPVPRIDLDPWTLSATARVRFALDGRRAH
jgi:HPr kinase/phosphorylase